MHRVFLSADFLSSHKEVEGSGFEQSLFMYIDTRHVRCLNERVRSSGE